MLSRVNKPNNYQSRSQFIEAALSFYLLLGESFTAEESLDNGLNAGMPARLDNLPPQWMTVNLGTVFNPVAGYSFYPLTQSSNIDYEKDKIFHWKEFNPDYDITGGHLRGMSRLRPLLKSVVGSTEAYNSLVKAFQNQGAWGLLTMLDDDPNIPLKLSEEQRSKLKKRFKSDSKKGELTIMNNNANWTKIGLTMIELEILKSIGIYKGNLCDAYNVPNQLLAGSTDRTYNNYKEAEAALWKNAICPSLNAYLEGLSNWLAPKFREEGTVLNADYSNVEALQKNMGEMVTWMVNSRSFTKNEIREAAGYEMLPLPGMDDIYGSMGDVPVSQLGMIPDDISTEEAMKALKLTDYRK